MKSTFTKVAVATVIAGSALFSETASAATKVEITATNQFEALKNRYDDGAGCKSPLW